MKEIEPTFHNKSNFGWTRDKRKAADEWVKKGSRAATPEEACHCYDKAVEIDPNNVAAWYNKGLVLDCLNRYDEAIQCYDRVIKINLNYANAWIAKGLALGALNRYDEAIKYYEKAIEIEPYKAGAWNWKGDAFRCLNQYDEAIRCYEKAIEIEPDYAIAWRSKGDVLRSLNRCDEAIRCYDRILELDPTDAVAWEEIGLALLNLGRYDKAIRCYNRALELDPKNAVVWHNKGFAHQKSPGGDNEAIRCYDRALELDSTDAVAWSNKGSVLLGLRCFDEAIQCCGRALELDPTDAVAWSNKGRALLLLSRYDDAIRCYDKALEIDLYDDDAWYHKGCALHNLGQYEEAIRCYDKPLEIYPKFAIAWINKGDALHNLGRYDEAIRCCDRVLELDPTDATARNMRDRILVESAKCARKNRSTPPRSDEARQSLQPSAHPGELAGTRQSITIERTVYDPLIRDFIVSSPRSLVNVRNWIDRHDPNSYWLVVCMRNYGDRAIDEWGIELVSSSSLRVLDATIEGIDGQVHLTTSNPKPWLIRLILGVPHHRGIVIPRDGSRRVYFRLGSESCGISHTIRGTFITGNVEIPIREKTFTHSCDIATLRAALSSEPAAAERYTQSIIRREYDRETALKLLRSFKLVQEIDQCCILQKYDEILNRMQLLAGTLESIQAGNKVTHLVQQGCVALEILGDSEASVEKARRLCGNIVDTWVNEFICIEDCTSKSMSHDRGEDAGKCPVCGSRLVWRRAQKNNELYRGCTNFDGGCRWNDRSY